MKLEDNEKKGPSRGTKVTTIKGDLVPLVECKKRENIYYKIGRDILNIEGRYLLPSECQVDNITKKLGSVNINLQWCYNGKFEPVASSDTCLLVVSEKVVPKKDGRIMHNKTDIPGILIVKICKSAVSELPIETENVASEIVNTYPVGFGSMYVPGNVLIHKSILPALEKETYIPNRRGGDRFYSSSVSPEKRRAATALVEDDRFKMFEEYLKDFTFGFELETIIGELIPSRYISYGMMKLYDGSITGNEYASSIMKVRNFGQLKDFMNLIQKNHSTDSTCSVHIHVGNIPFNNVTLLAMHKMFYSLQDELHECCYQFKKDPRFLGRKQNYKDHCAYLQRLTDNKSIEELCKRYFEWAKLPFRKLCQTSESEEKLNSTEKWHVLSRYYFVNFTNYVMKENGTIELRLLQGSLNFDRVMYWLLVNMAVIKKVIAEKEAILNSKEKYELKDIVHEVYDKKIAERICSFIDEQKRIFFQAKVSGDMMTDRGYFSNTGDIVQTRPLW